MMGVSMQIVDRKTAAQAGLSRFYTGRPCRSGHDSERYTASGNCIVCHQKRAEEFKRAPRMAPLAVRHYQNDLGLTPHTIWVHPTDAPMVDALVKALIDQREADHATRHVPVLQAQFANQFQGTTTALDMAKQSAMLDQREAEMMAREGVEILTNNRCLHHFLLTEPCAWCSRS
jgi:hypothetical protein